MIYLSKGLARQKERRKNRQQKKAVKLKQPIKQGKKRMLRKIIIMKWQDKVPKRKIDPETRQPISYDDLQDNDTLKLLNFIVNSIDPKNLPKGNIDQIRFWNRFEIAMKNAGMDSHNSNPEANSELKEFIYLDNEAWKLITEKGLKDLDPRIGRNQETFEALELIIDATEYDPNQENEAPDGGNKD